MSLTEREKEIALECATEHVNGNLTIVDTLLYFLSRIREEQDSETCDKCGGDGRLRHNKYTNGTYAFGFIACYKCDGKGIVPCNAVHQEAPCDCSELVEALEKLSNAVENLGICEGGQDGRLYLENMAECADKALANHAKRMQSHTDSQGEE